MKPDLWNELHFMPASSIDEFIEHYAEKNKQVLKGVDFFQLVKAFLRRIIKK